MKKHVRFVFLHVLIYWQTIATLEVPEKLNLQRNSTELPGNETEARTDFLFYSETTLADEEDNAEEIPNNGLEDLELDNGKADESNSSCDKVCGLPPFVENASPFDSKQTTSAVGSVVTYTCEFGYVASGSKRSTTCHISGAAQQAQWTTVQLKCSPRSCGDPGYVPNGRVVGSLFTFAHNVTIECDEGYERRGQKSRICQANGEWSGSLPICQRVSCLVPGSPLNGKTIFSSLDYGSELGYECQKGFRIDKKERRICDKTGKWSGVEPICTEMFCDPPAAPDYGSVQILDEGLKPGSLVLFACDEGRTLVGSARSTCSADGEWIFPTPRCVVPCVIPRIFNGAIGKYEMEYRRLRFKKIRIGSEVIENEEQIFRCDDGYFIFGKTTEEVQVSCLDGKWSENFACVSSRCAGEPPPTKHAMIRSKNHQHGGTVSYLCNTLFYKVKSGNVTCLFGRWEGVTPVCEKKDCLVSELNDPGIQDSPRVYKNGYSYDPSCKAGYETSKVANKLVCREGNWTGYILPCQPASCRNDPPWMSNGRAIPDCRIHGCTVTYICENSLTLKGNSTVRCQHGAWVGHPPICSSDSCRVPRISNGEVGNYVTDYYGARVYRRNRPGDEMQAGVEYLFRCYDNYHVAGKRSQEINAYCINGALSEPLQCASSRCSENPPPTENAYISRKSNHHGGTVTYQCLLQFEKKKFGNVTCLFGQWEGITPACQRIGTSTSSLAKEKETIALLDDRAPTVSTSAVELSLPVPTSTLPANTEILEPNPECTCQYLSTDQNLMAYVSGRKLESGSKISQGSTVTFGCHNFGYLKLIGQREDVCAVCGQRINLPRCEPPIEGDTVVTYEGDFSVGGINLLEVKKGGNLKFFCYAFRFRQYAYPEWVKPSRRNSKTSYSDLSYLTTILDITSLSEQHSGQYTCGGIYLTPTILNVRVVVESKRSCPVFPRSGEYLIRYEEDRAHFTCRKANQKLRGASVLLCDPNGYWSDEPPECIDLECPDLVERGNFTLHLTDGKKVGSTASFHCFSPLQLKGNASLKCLRNGTWSAEAPTCVLPVCSVDELYSLMPEFMYPVMENVDGEIVPFGSNFTLQCEDNQQITQPAKAVCGAGGKWIIPSVTCISGCGPFAKDSGSVVIVEPQQNFYRLGEQILLSCPPGLTLTREIEVVMCFGGKWSEVDIPDCQ